MKNIHLVPTDKPSKLIQRRITKELKYSLLNNSQLWNNVNIYITSDEKIKEGDWYENNNVIFKADEIFDEGNNPNNSNPRVTDFNKKIILTTDQNLINDGVQEINDEFLQWFESNSNCEYVEIENNKCLITRGNCDCSELDIDCQRLGYKMTLPKEKPNNLNYGGGFTEEDIKRVSRKRFRQETLSNPIIIIRNDDKLEFIHLGNGMYRTKWGILNNSISKIPLEVFDKSKFTFYYE